MKLAAALAIAFAITGAAWADPVKTKVTGGTVVGDSADGIATYKGIPYAAPPLGNLRWEPPKPVVAWKGDKQATEFSPSCMQRSRGGQNFSEDCLYLNVYAPAGAKNAPVMVWIHGGSNLTGSGSIYNGAAFAKDGIVTVTINYRMGAFGFFAHPEITKAAKKTDPLANYGLMDQTAALQWVQKNIAAFGGDPKQVTVFGESAGAINIYALLGLKSSKGLFNQAILESNITWGDSAPLKCPTDPAPAAPGRPACAGDAESDGKALMKRAGAADDVKLADMRKIPAEKLVDAQGSARFPMVDGRFMTETSLQAMANKHTLDVPLVLGTNSYEASLASQLKDPAAQADWTNNNAGAPARYIAKQSADGKPAWLYFFSYVATARRTPDSPGASHASEISYVYGGMTRPLGGGGPPPAAPAAAGGPNAATPAAAPPAPPPPSDEDKAMATLMHSCWVAFAKTGAPTCASGPAWPKYDAASDQLMEFGAPSGVRTNFRKEALDKATAAEANAK